MIVDHDQQLSPFDNHEALSLGPLFDDPETLHEGRVSELQDSETESLYLYQKAISKIPILSPIQVRHLAVIKNNGASDQETIELIEVAKTLFAGIGKHIEEPADPRRIAYDCLFVGNLRLAAHVARLTTGRKPGKKTFGQADFKINGDSIFKGAIFKDLSQFASEPMPLEDRIQHANFGLMNAVKNYDPDRGTALTTYAMYYIEQAITRAIKYDSTIRVPINIHEKLDSARKAGTQETTPLPSISGDRYVVLGNGAVNSVLEGMIRGMVQLDEIADEVEATQIDPHSMAETTILGEAVRRALDHLPERSRTIIEKRFGFGDYDPHTLEEIGNDYGLTRERIRQIEDDALKLMMRSGLAEQIL